MAVTLPVVLLIIDWYPFRRLAAVRDIKTVLFEKIPFFSLSASSALITIFAQKSAVIKVATLPVSVRTGNGINSIWSYIQNMLLPGDLIPFYPHSVNFNFFSYKFIFSLIFFSGVTLIFLFLARKQKIWLSIWGYYLITLFPVLGIIQVGSQAMADRYMYLPSIGPFFLVGLGAVLAVEYFKRQKDMLRLFSLFTALIIPASLMYATLGQIDKWKDGVSLWGYEIGVLLKKSDRNYKTLAMAYLNRGQAYFMQKSYEKAIQDFTKAVEFNPKCADCYNNRGVAYLKTGGLERALRDYDYGIFLEPGSYAAYVNRGIIYSRLERYADALTDYNKSIELKPDNPEIFYNRGLTYARLGRLQEAVGDYTTAINTSPHPDYYYSRGTALKKLGYEKEALADLMLAGK
ncbi:MAG: tetratricopeptide repeat protein [Nitrospirae bacterium]|nr:tetratricopeptide repeat protein [Nitrospirota bacterium]